MIRAPPSMTESRLIKCDSELAMMLSILYLTPITGSTQLDFLSSAFWLADLLMGHLPAYYWVASCN